VNALAYGETAETVTALPELPPGMYLGVPEHVYHAKHLGLVRNTALGWVGVAPASYYAWVTGVIEDEETKALSFGKALHCATLEPHVFAQLYAVEPDFGDCRANAKTGTTKEEGANNKVRRDLWRLAHEGHIFLSHEDHTTILGMAAALQRHPMASKILAWPGGVREATIRWDIPGLGLPAAIRTDLLVTPIDLAADLKSTLDASEDAFSRSIEKFGYHRQAALYRDGLAAIGRAVDDFLFFAVEKTPPYLVGIYKLDEKDEQAGREQNFGLMCRLHDCLMRGEWPGLSTEVLTIRRPRWAR
jgi:PDDEXK-like domain of unknown function (DUF3799)